MDCYLSCYLDTHPDKKQGCMLGSIQTRKLREIKRKNLVELIVCTNGKQDPCANTYAFHSYNIDLLSILHQYLHIFQLTRNSIEDAALCSLQGTKQLPPH